MSKMQTKACRLCRKIKKVTEDFYYRKYNYDSRCKDCHNEISSRNSVKKYDREKARIIVAKRISLGKHIECDRRMRQKYPEKAHARESLRYEVKMGRIKKEKCHECGDIKTQGHHPDYSKPLEVIWLCIKHHAILHRKYK